MEPVVLDVGGGTGTLAKLILEHLQKSHPEAGPEVSQNSSRWRCDIRSSCHSFLICRHLLGLTEELCFATP